MPDNDRLFNKTQGDTMNGYLANIILAIQGLSTERLKLDWSYTTLPASGRTDTIYAIPTGDTSDPWDFYVWNDTDDEWVRFDFEFTVDAALSDSSTNPVQNKVVKSALDGKVDTVTGKGLSTNDFTDALQTKLNGISAGAEVNVQSDWSQTDDTADDFIKNKPTIPAAQVQADWSESDDTAVDFIKNKPNLATVATSGSYEDLSNKPTIPAAQVNSDWDASSGVTQILNKPTLGTAAAADIDNEYDPDNEDVATGKTIADAFDYFGFSIVNGKLCQTYTT